MQRKERNPKKRRQKKKPSIKRVFFESNEERGEKEEIN